MTPDHDRIDQAAKQLGRTVRKHAVRDPEPDVPPFIDRDDGKLYFIAADGVRYRVHDTTFANYRDTVVPIGAPHAHYRNFVTAERTRRVYQFRKGELHDVTVPHLERQLRESDYAPPPRKPGDPDPTDRKHR